MRLAFFQVNSGYCDFLREVDSLVPHTMAAKATRPFIGIVFSLNNFNYYAPLTSPKPKHLHMKNRLDFLKINGGQWGAINFNNMIPVAFPCLTQVELKVLPDDKPLDIAYKNLLTNQLTWCNAQREVILQRAAKLYRIIASGRADAKLQERCCNFVLLEERCKLFALGVGADNRQGN